MAFLKPAEIYKINPINYLYAIYDNIFVYFSSTEQETLSVNVAPVSYFNYPMHLYWEFGNIDQLPVST